MNEPERRDDELFAESLLKGGDFRRDDTLRRAMLEQTSRVVRRRRIVRRAGWTAAFVGCYLAGMATMQAIGQLGNRVAPIAWTVPAPPATISPQPATGRMEENTSTEPLVIIANRDSKVRRKRSPFDVLRTAGDRSLNERGDLRAAIRYYGKAIKEASREELEISRQEDSWLLISLKQARLQEVGNDKSSG